ncbi:adenylate/guanylate cyclase domain-containing protein [Marimonas sp. MJW-29]|uniref:Adenylate/guanylate cyclase domain-containing protein n=1 Tax=Sulfitobacter sediminis TaxID=3234186 RepID=A0ABV3RLY3_9RHOB
MDGRPHRQLAAILVIDVVGYSRLMGLDEEGTLEVLKRLRRTVISPQVAAYRGRVVKVMGDGAIMIFGSIIDATNAALAVQQAMERFAPGLPGVDCIRLRVGLNLGDVIREGTDIYGDGVNIAARLQEICPPGAIVLSSGAHEQVQGKISERFVNAGARQLKNIAQPVRVYVWPPDAAEAAGETLAAPDLPDKPSVVVLPFDNMSGDPAQEYFADGVVEALTAALSRIRSFFVIARNSAFAYKGVPKNVGQIGRELGVAYLLEGSVQRAPGRLRITVQLIETATGNHLWAERYDGTEDEVFELQDRITEQVAGAILPSIQRAEIARVIRKPPESLGAYDFTLRAMQHVWMLDKNRSATALDLLNKALDIDPDYPLALALAAWCWAQHSVYNWIEDIESAKTKALQYAERAASLSSEDPLILAVLGTVQTFARNFGVARVLLQRAITLDENSAWTHSRLGWLEVYSDRPTAAIPHFEHAIRLSPVDPMNFNNYVGIASAYQVAENYAESAEYFERAIIENPTAYWIHRNLAPVLLAAGRKTDAKKSAEILFAEFPDLTVERFKKAMVFSAGALERLSVFLRQLGVPER